MVLLLCLGCGGGDDTVPPHEHEPGPRPDAGPPPEVTCEAWDEAQFVDPAPYTPTEPGSAYGDSRPSGVNQTITSTTREGAHAECLNCHQMFTPGEVARYEASVHRSAADPVLCLDCHGTEDHGLYVALGYRFSTETLGADGVTPIGSGREHTYWEWYPRMIVKAMRSCQDGNCHARNYRQHIGPRLVTTSTPATTPFHGMLRYDHGISSWNDAMMSSFGIALWETYGTDVFRENCVRCHSQTMAFNVAGFDPESMTPTDDFLQDMLQQQSEDIPEWDGLALPGVPDSPLLLSRCVECHVRHSFSRTSPRNAVACAKCHSGPDHPQYEAYSLSKHALVVAEHGPYSPENLEGGPTCSTCHLSADPNAPPTSTGPAINHDLTLGMTANFDTETAEWNASRAAMLDRCRPCHAVNYALTQLLSADHVARETTAELMGEIIALCDAAYERGLIEPAENPFFDEPVQFLPTFFHALPWRSGKYRVSNIEAACWDAWREFGVLSQETGAWHFSPQHAQWRGTKVAQEFIGELRELLAFEEAGYCAPEE